MFFQAKLKVLTLLFRLAFPLEVAYRARPHSRSPRTRSSRRSSRAQHLPWRRCSCVSRRNTSSPTCRAASWTSSSPWLERKATRFCSTVGSLTLFVSTRFAFIYFVVIQLVGGQAREDGRPEREGANHQLQREARPRLERVPAATSTVRRSCHLSRYIDSGFWLALP